MKLYQACPLLLQTSAIFLMLAYLVTELHWFHQRLHVLIDYCFVHCHVCKALVFPTTCRILQLGIKKLLMIISLSLFPENGYWRPYVLTSQLPFYYL